MYSYAVEPPEIANERETFHNDYYGSKNVNEYYESAVIWVPEGSLAKYRADEIWNKFVDIREMSADKNSVYDVVNSSAKVRGTAGGIVVESAEETPVEVYTTAGMLVHKAIVNGSATIDVAPGLYIVRAAGQPSKVIVK